MPSPQIYCIEEDATGGLYLENISALPEGSQPDLKKFPRRIELGVEDLRPYEREHFLHIPNQFKDDPRWDLSQVPFRNISICIHESDSTQHEPATRNFPSPKELSTKLAHMVRFLSQRGLLSDYVTPIRIYLIGIDKFNDLKGHNECSRSLPVSEPWCFQGLSKSTTQVAQYSERMRDYSFRDDAWAWIEALFERTSRELNGAIEPKYVLEVRLGEMPLACRCSNALETLREKIMQIADYAQTGGRPHVIAFRP